jgi:hypothetical protein
MSDLLKQQVRRAVEDKIIERRGINACDLDTFTRTLFFRGPAREELLEDLQGAEVLALRQMLIELVGEGGEERYWKTMLAIVENVG